MRLQECCYLCFGHLRDWFMHLALQLCTFSGRISFIAVEAIMYQVHVNLGEGGMALTENLTTLTPDRKWGGSGSNRRPTDYESDALTN